MVFTNIGKSGVALSIGSFATFRPQYLALGNGSGAVAITNVNLVAESGTRQQYTSIDNSVSRYIEYIFDWNSLVMSGLNLTEFGFFTESATSTGSLWLREGFKDVEFDGTNELQIQLKLQSYPIE